MGRSVQKAANFHGCKIVAHLADSKVNCFNGNKKNKAGESNGQERSVDELSGSNRCCGDHASG